MAVSALPSEDLDRDAAKWAAYKAKHSKSYTHSEEIARKAQFLATEKMINDHNSDPTVTYTLVHNEHSDKTDEERQSLLGTVLPSSLNADRSADAFSNPEEVAMALERASASLDLRSNTSCVGPVKNQGQCGSCWAFSAIAALEFSYCQVKNNIYTSLSEQQLVDCDPYDGGCNGGWPSNGWTYLESANTGSETSAAYPYTALTGTCAFSNSKAVAHVKSWASVSSNPSAVVAAVNQHGVLSVAIFVNNNFQHYGGGLYTDTTCNGQGINHGVAIVGYGTDSATKKDYWIVRNSWGPGWGQAGYILMLRGVNQCNIESYVNYVQAY